MVRKTRPKTSSKEAGEQRPISINLMTISLVARRMASSSPLSLRPGDSFSVLLFIS